MKKVVIKESMYNEIGDLDYCASVEDERAPRFYSFCIDPSSYSKEDILKVLDDPSNSVGKKLLFLKSISYDAYGSQYNWVRK